MKVRRRQGRESCYRNATRVVLCGLRGGVLVWPLFYRKKQSCWVCAQLEAKHASSVTVSKCGLHLPTVVP